MMKISQIVFVAIPVCCTAARIRTDAAAELTSNASTVASGAPVSFYANMAKLKIWGYQSMFCGHDTMCSHIENYPSPDSYVEMEAAKVAAEMAKVPDRQRSGEIVRGNDLGFFILNKGLWQNDGEYQTIGLGVSVPTHEYIRPIFDGILHPSQQRWNTKYIEDQIRAFIASHDEIDTNGGLMPLMTKLMHKFHLDMDLEDSQVKEFIDFQGAALAPSIMNDLGAKALGGFSDVVAQRQKWLDRYMDKMEKDTRGVFPADMTGRNPGEKMYIVASGLMDSMLFAGGLSVEGLTKSALNVLYSTDHKFLGDGDTSYEGFGAIGEEDVEAFVYEVARLFPAVVGFPWWSPEKDGKPFDANRGGEHYTRRTVMNLALSLRDPRVWGSDYKKFVLRSTDFYKKNMGNAWAMSGNEAGDGPGGLGKMSRGCPGQQLSMTIVTSFIREWIKQKDNWVVGPGTEQGLKFQDVTPFLSSSFAKFVRPKKTGVLSQRKEGASLSVAQNRYFSLEGTILRSYDKKEDRISDQTEGSEAYDLSKVTGSTLRSEYYFEKDGDTCFIMKNKVPWGPFAGSSWEDNQLFCTTDAADAQDWVAALSGAPF